MRLVWVTGTSGSGTSTVCGALRALGHRAVDTDAEGWNEWVDRQTGEVVADAPPGSLDRFAWRIRVDRVEALAADPDDEGVTFLCGSVENEVDVWHRFDAAVCLVADDETIVRRLSGRTTNAFGTHPDELAAVLSWNPTQAQRYRDLGAVVVDATRPLDEVVGAVLAVSAQ